MIKDVKLLSRVEPIIKQVGQMQRSYFARARSLVRHEKNGAGIVTEADLESEKFLIDNLSQILLGADFFAEESGISGDGDYRWVIDPLDGTTNFAHGIPHFCISVALTYKNSLICGAIYQPILDEFFWAQKGNGAWLNGKKIKVTNPESLEKGLLLVGLPYNAKQADLNKVFGMAPKVFTFRHLGAAALDLAYVACGRADGVFFAGMEWWDYAAGDLLIREAGGQTSDFEGEMVNPGSKSFVGGGPMVYKELVKGLQTQ